MISNLFTTLLYQPLFNLLVFLYNVIPGQDLGVAIIALTVLVRFILYPLSSKSIKSQRRLQSLQPELEKIKKQSKSKEEQTKAVMEFYKKNRINPFSSCLPLLIQFPILIAIYRILRDGIGDPEQLNLLYSFVENPGKLNPTFLGLADLSTRNVYLAVLAGAAQFWQSRMLLQRKKKDKRKKDLTSVGGIASSMSNQMIYIMPIITVFIAMSFPAGLALYWLTTTLFGVAQQWIIMGKKLKVKS